MMMTGSGRTTYVREIYSCQQRIVVRCFVLDEEGGFVGLQASWTCLVALSKESAPEIADRIGAPSPKADIMFIANN